MAIIVTFKSDAYEKSGKLTCNNSLSNWLDSTQNPNILSYVKYNEDDQPLDSENPKIMIDLVYFQQSYGGIEFKGIFEKLAIAGV